MQRLRFLRESLHLTQLSLACELGLSQQTINNYENGISEPSLDTLCRIAAFFHVSVDFLLGGNTPGAESCSREEQEFLSLLRSMDKSSRSATVSLLRAFAGKQAALSLNEQNLLAGFRQLSPQDQANIISCIFRLAKADRAG